MSKLKKFATAAAGVGILMLALYLAAFVFVVLLIIGTIFAIYVYFKTAPLRKDIKKHQAEYEKSSHGQFKSGQTIETEYIVVDEQRGTHTDAGTRD